MAEVAKDGRHYLEDINNVFAAVGSKLDAPRQQKISELQARGERVQKKLFLKTQGGTDLAAKAAELATKLRSEVDAGAPEPTSTRPSMSWSKPSSSSSTGLKPWSSG